MPRSLPAGSRTAIFVLGSCFHRRLGVRDIELVVGGAATEATAQGMPRLDRYRALPDAHSYRSGFWAIVPVEAPPAGEIEVAVRATLADGTTAVAPVGRIPVSDLPSMEPEAIARAGSGARVAIAMATFDPDPELFRNQVESIRAQTIDDWICVVSDDCTPPPAFERMRAVLDGDRRFVLSRSGRRLGFYKNFERALALVRSSTPYVALADQDDRWYPEKLQTLLDSLGDAQLVYSDQRVVDTGGRVVAEGYWTDQRRNNYTNLASLLIANTVTGAASLFRRELLDVALPFPEPPGDQFHDHWLGLVALSTGGSPTWTVRCTTTSSTRAPRSDTSPPTSASTGACSCRGCCGAVEGALFGVAGGLLPRLLPPAAPRRGAADACGDAMVPARGGRSAASPAASALRWDSRGSRRARAALVRQDGDARRRAPAGAGNTVAPPRHGPRRGPPAPVRRLPVDASLRAAERSTLRDSMPSRLEADPYENDPGHWGASLVNAAEILFPCLDAAGAKSVAEVGAYAGDLTGELIKWADRSGARVIAIDPTPEPQLVELAEERADLELIRETSHEALRQLELPDAVIIDGDHNYYTVSEELRLIGEKAPGAELPLLMFHDVGWPHARRDTYFAPEQIPEEHRQPIAEPAGLFPGDPGVVEGALLFHYGAEREGGPRNGVLTAIEDFIEGPARASGSRRSPCSSASGSCGIPRRRGRAPWREIVEPWDHNPLLARLEANRVFTWRRCTRDRANARLEWRLARIESRLARQEQLLNALLDSGALAMADRSPRCATRAGDLVARSGQQVVGENGSA